MSTDPEVLDKIKRACSPQKAIYDMAEYMGGYDADIIKAENAANAAAAQANSAYNRATDALNTANGVTADVGRSLVDLNAAGDGSTVTLNAPRNTGNPATAPLPVADATKAGVMNSATYVNLQNLNTRVSSLENQTTTYIVSFTNDNPTQDEINNAYKTAYPNAPFPPIDGTTVIDSTRQLYYRWVKNGAIWLKTTGFVISQFTNETAGTIKGSAIAGQIQAETDGTGSLVGYDQIKNDISANATGIRTLTTNLGTTNSDLTALTTRVNTNTSNIANTVNTINAVGTETGADINYVKMGGTQASTALPVVSADQAGIATPAMFNAWNSGGGSKIQTHYNIDVSNTNALSPLVLITDKNDNAVQFYVTYTPANNKLIIAFQYINAVIIAQNKEGFNYKRTSALVPSLSFVNNNMPLDGTYEDNIIVNLFKQDGSAVYQVALHYRWSRTDSTTTPTQIIDASAIAF